MKFLAKCIGGSQMYGLSTPESDTDYRGVYVNDDIGHILGLGKDNLETKIEKNPEEKTEGAFFEIRHFMGLLRKTNTMVLEILFNEDWIEKTTGFDLILKEKFQLLDSERFYKSLRGYMQAESRLAFGERTGTLGSKRKEALDKNEYSHKNVVNLLRLCVAGQIFFSTGIFPVKMQDGKFKALLMNIKTKPEKYSVEDLKSLIEDHQGSFEYAAKYRVKNYTFNEDIANDLLRKIYFPLVKNYYGSPLKVPSTEEVTYL